LIAAGGAGGYGNLYFLTATNRSPKFATCRHNGVRITLKLELKLVVDVGLVGFPNARKSTLLNALTNRHAEVAAYAFTTLNPQVGTVRVLWGGDFDGSGGEVFRFTIADNPGLIAQASESSNTENVGLGHALLRSIKRARALAYVVDLSGDRLWGTLDVRSCPRE
ncbi:P-loop containing nucleoside triphosphate hydrolase protein, partial [Gautieria morchelliformis]